MAGLRSTLRRWHIWLGWLIGVPMLLWSVSGVLMVVKPIEEVRGAALLSDMPPVRLAASAIAPAVDLKPTTKLTLEQRATGPRWVLAFADGASRLADPATGRLLPAMSAADAARELGARYTGKARIASVTHIDPANPPLDLRRPLDSWKVAMSDGTFFYVDRWTGEIAARRTAWWRFYDFMWGVHIMDLQTREDAHNPWLIGFGIVAALTTIMALILLPMTGRRKKKRPTA
ncbi:MAG: PepSY domain-containing protein [Sphingomonas bacterium]|nr:PepSY domain-containing protein [Sphingomonas bacterium]